ncbi:MAG: lytic transglycosylase domain-containing protein [Bacteroidetes bacterium]|nr:lytic transglycosylase domain-containing protein [Bacteroidota bacterium]
MKEFFLQMGNTKLKTAIVCLIFSISLSTLTIQSSASTTLKNIKPIDTTGQPAVTSITDSSKIFGSLLSDNPSDNMNYSMNADAKLFIDNFIKKNQDYYTKMKVWGKPYFDLYDKILSSYGLPTQLKYLSVIESSLSSTSVSWAGAVGPWQIMPETARENGLNTSYYNDERQDYIKSTNAACKILKGLYGDYGDWLLVIAAYNCGSAPVDRAIAKAHSKSFWDIQYLLPLETRNHVKKFIATHYFFDGNTNMGDMPGSAPTINAGDNSIANNAYLQLAANSTTINLYGKYNSVVIANNLMMDINIFNQLNPDFDKSISKGDIYPMRIPSDKVDLFQSKKADMLKQSVELLLNGSNITTAGK